MEEHFFFQLPPTIRLQNNSTVRKSLDFVYPSHTRNTRNRTTVPFSWNDTIQMSCKYNFIDIWNKLPTEFCESASLSIFRKKLFNDNLKLFSLSNR